MAEHTVRIRWERGEARFLDQRYSRAHRWEFDGGVSVPASSSPHVVREPFSDPSAVDPEEAFVASLSSCHMLWFLSIAAKRGFVVDSYGDDPVGFLEKEADGRVSMTRIVLRPRILFGGPNPPGPDEVQAMHDEAHHSCFLANSVRTEIVVE